MEIFNTTGGGGGGGARFPDADLNFHIYVNNVCICIDWKVLTQ